MTPKRNTVLLIDDNQLNLNMLSLRLEKTGFRVICRQNGQQITDVVIKVQPDVILLDILMPELDGYAIAHSLKATSAIAHIPLIAVTALAMSGDRERALAAGCDDYVTKPINYPHLIERMLFYLERSRPL